MRDAVYAACLLHGQITVAAGRMTGAEFIFANALGIDVRRSMRDDWAPYDLKTEDGIRIEVKASAYVQSWGQSKASVITWSVSPRRRWDADEGKYIGEAQLHADVFVFALFTPEEKTTTAAPLDVSQWKFFVRGKDDVPMRATGDLGDRMDYAGLAAAVHAAAAASRP